MFFQHPLKEEDSILGVGHTSLMNMKIQESLKNKEAIRETRKKIKVLNDKVLNNKMKEAMRYILHNGYWKYKKSHFIHSEE